MSIKEYRSPIFNFTEEELQSRKRIKGMLDFKIIYAKEDDSMSIEAIKKKLEDFRIEWEASRGCADMTDFSDDVEYLLKQNNQLREERDSFQRVGIKVQEVNVRLVEALEKAEKAFKRLSTGDFSAPMEMTQIEAYQAYATSAHESIQAYKLLEKKD